MATLRKPIEALLEESGRFSLRRRLGAGGMGVVYEVMDHKRDALVALKALRKVSATGLYLFKQEFRALSDVTHPNLITLYELLIANEQWFFTMELVHGVDVQSYLRRQTVPKEAAQLIFPSGEDTATGAGCSASKSQQTAPTGASSEQTPLPHEHHMPVSAREIRPIFAQLVQGIDALHASGHLHCDIKPSNVIVDANGRLVVLDYGVITAVAARRRRASLDGLRGTPAYCSPEQAAGLEPTKASDWYSVGVILYQALAGRRPFAGTSKEVLAAKQVQDPPRPAEFIDDELAELCMRLMSRDPGARPDGDAILSVLDATEPGHGVSAANEIALWRAADAPELVARERELATLNDAFDRSRAGEGQLVRVRGRTGMGKTALVQYFLEHIDDDDVLILRGRCYERESVPHQAIDGLVDSLCQYLLALSRQEADELMPADVLAMARAFPVLGRVDAVAHARRRATTASGDVFDLRRRAFAALRELFSRIAARQALVLFIDDLQWGDVDSAPFLLGLLHEPAPPLMLVVTYRSEEVESSALLRKLLDSDDDDSDMFVSSAKIAIERLSIPQAHALAAALLTSAGMTTEVAERIARESRGNPFFIHEFVRYVSTATREDSPVPPLAEVLMERVGGISRDGRTLLEVVCVAGKPVLERIARRSAGLGDGHQRAVAELRAAQLIRTSGSDDGLVLETAHDQIRSVVASSLAPDALVGLHERLAEAMVSTDGDDPESLTMHYFAAGRHLAAREYALVAASKAADALAFERTAAFYQLALDLTDSSDHEQVAYLGRMLGDALVNAGRGADAPPVYLAAAAQAGAEDARVLQVRAGSELLRSGRVAAGVDLLRGPLAESGIKLARSNTWAALSLLFRRGYSRMRGLGFAPQSDANIVPSVLTRIDACHAAAAGLAMVDPLRGAYVQTRHLVVALRAGDSFRIGRALSYEAGFLSIGGLSAESRVRKISQKVRAIADELDEPYLEALHHTHSALADYQRGSWQPALDHAHQASTTYLRDCTGSAWERMSVKLYELWSLYWLGEFAALTESVRAARRDARDRGDLYASVSLAIGLPSFAGLAVDKPEETQRSAERAASQWTHPDYHLQHFWVQSSIAQCELYRGEGAAAYERVQAQWPRLKRAFLLSVVMVRAEVLHLSARCALAAAAKADDGRPWLMRARRLARRFGKLPLPWCAPARQLVDAAVAAGLGDREASLTHLEQAEAGLHAVDTHAFAVAAAYRRGQLMGGERGRELVATAHEWLRGQRVANVDRVLGFLAPGFPVQVEGPVEK